MNPPDKLWLLVHDGGLPPILFTSDPPTYDVGERWRLVGPYHLDPVSSLLDDERCEAQMTGEGVCCGHPGQCEAEGWK
jgi:hypothetical protein